jgi:SAM-dependent methyltransferase
VRSRASAAIEGSRAGDAEPRFAVERPGDIREARAWHRYRHHIRTLPPRLEALSRDLRVPPGGRVLDYGCAELPYRHFFGADIDYVGADLPGNPHATIELASDGTLPVPSESFDAVMSTQVLEHVADPELHLREAHRVLTPGGRMLLSTHGIFVYHPDPDDYWRWTCAGLERAVTEAGFRMTRFEGIIGLVPTGLQLVQDAIYWRLRRAPAKALWALAMQTLIATADRFTRQSSRDLNAQVFALIAEKPAEPVALGT